MERKTSDYKDTTNHYDEKNTQRPPRDGSMNENSQRRFLVTRNEERH